jgi:hypothetical protein
VNLARLLRKRPQRLLLFNAVLLSLLAPLRQAAAQAKHETPDTVTLQCDLRYCEGTSAAWKLDLAYPKDPGTKPRPALVVIRGAACIPKIPRSLLDVCRGTYRVADVHAAGCQ